MSLLNMSLTGGVFILAVLLLRAVFQNIVPRRTFLALWLAANALLLIPLRFRLPMSIYALLDRGTAEASVQTAAEQMMHASAPVRALPWWQIVWLSGAALLLAVVLIAHGRNLLRFRRAVPVERQPEGVPARVRVKVLPGLPSPLAYGLFRPTILIPAEDFAPPGQARHVYLHELCHIRHLDVARRYLMLFALAVHWFNPLVWIMYYVASQDMEMRCDEQAIRQLGTKKAYAATLVAMETGKLQHLLDAGFSFSSTGSRLKAILKAKRLPVISLVLALALCIVTLTVFGTDAAVQIPSEPVQASEAAASPAPEPEPPIPPEPEEPESAEEPPAQSVEEAPPEPTDSEAALVPSEAETAAIPAPAASPVPVQETQPIREPVQQTQPIREPVQEPRSVREPAETEPDAPEQLPEPPAAPAAVPEDAPAAASDPMSNISVPLPDGSTMGTSLPGVSPTDLSPRNTSSMPDVPGPAAEPTD